MSIENIPNEITKKVPGFDQYKAHPSAAVSYVFMLLFFGYFIYKEYVSKDDYSEKIAMIEKVSTQKDGIIEKLNERVTKLEIAIDVCRGVIPMEGGSK